MTIIDFPRPLRARRLRAVAPAKIFCRVEVFPSWRNRRIVAGIAAEMRDQSTVGDAEEILFQHLEIEAHHLERLGVSDLNKIEAELSAFARRAWAAYHRGETGLGGVA